ncbi:MAG: chorismate-binding protein [Paludibacteraceae bacterium]|nr:chorismate-binding protein [Paludibacteraceae bacterium]
MQIEDFLSLCVSKQVPFFCYRLPEEKGLRIGVQRSSELLSFSSVSALSCLENQCGFLVAPFDLTSENKIYFIQSDILIDDEVPSYAVEYLSSFPQKSFDNDLIQNLSSQKKDDYVASVVRLVDEIKKGEANKVVYSRMVPFEVPSLKDKLPKVFSEMLEKYKDAYLFWFNIPGVSMWMGASPELFLRKKAERVETVALAGTQLSVEKWSSKNKEEQLYVENFIREIFTAQGLTDIRVDGPISVKAGNVYHLKTQLSGQMEDASSWTDLLEALHPTPAVCGCPKEKAKPIIQRMEASERGFYSGFLGFLDGNANFEFCVNLRSMRLLSDKALLYVGGGITKDSDCEEEWRETEMKLTTMANVLETVNA